MLSLMKYDAHLFISSSVFLFFFFFYLHCLLQQRLFIYQQKMLAFQLTNLKWSLMKEWDCPLYSLNSIIIWKRENAKIITFEFLEPVNSWYSCLKKCLKRLIIYQPAFPFKAKVGTYPTKTGQVARLSCIDRQSIMELIQRDKQSFAHTHQHHMANLESSLESKTVVKMRTLIGSRIWTWFRYYKPKKPSVLQVQNLH